MMVLVSGLPGSGKSFFAEKLAARIGAVYINSDKVRKTLHAAGKYSFWVKLAVYKEMARMAREALEQGKAVVLDATFYRHVMRNLFVNLAEEKSCAINFIEVYADEAVIRDRLKNPRADSEADFNIYEKIKREYDKISEPHLKLKSENDNITVMLNKALHYLDSVHERV